MNNKRKRIEKLFEKFAVNLYNGKFVLLATVICTVVMIALFMQFFLGFTKSVRERTVDAAQQSIKQVEINILATMKQTENISDMICNNSSIQTYLDTPTGGNNIARYHAEYAEYDVMNDFFNSTVNIGDDIIGIRLFVDNEKKYSHEHYYFFSEDDLKLEPWYQTAMEAKGKVRWVFNYESDSPKVSCVRMVKSLSVYDKTIGALAVDLPEKKLMKILSDISVLSNDGENNVYLIDENGLVISASRDAQIGEELIDSEDMKEIRSSAVGTKRYGQGRKSSCIIYRQIEGTDWKIAAIVPWKEISSYQTVMYSMPVITVIIILIVFLTVLFAANFFSYSMRKKIRELALRIEKENIDELEKKDIHRDVYSMQRLQDGIEDMILQINNTMREYHKAKDKEREAYMQALQAQINPHFLYNVFDAINWMAVRIGADDICFMVEHLAEYFRLSLNRGKAIVTVADELKLLKIYVTIQNRRFSDCVTMDYNIDEEFYDYLIPKISLQPIIENAIIHGIQEKRGYKGRIVIDSKIDSGYLIITISDDGIGMKEEKLKNCMKLDAVSQHEYTKSGYGLYNVDERLKLFSKDDNCGLSIESVYGEGTVVTMKITAKKEQST